MLAGGESTGNSALIIDLHRDLESGLVGVADLYYVGTCLLDVLFIYVLCLSFQLRCFILSSHCVRDLS